MTKKLETLEEFNKRKMQTHLHIKNGGSIGNGIACPCCGNELCDSNHTTILTSYPPQIRVECKHCNHKGTRVL